jgi:hypothetical protein
MPSLNGQATCFFYIAIIQNLSLLFLPQTRQIEVFAINKMMNTATKQVFEVRNKQRPTNKKRMPIVNYLEEEKKIISYYTHKSKLSI